MIKINLTPELELESQYWWVPSVAIILMIAAAGYFYGSYEVGKMKEEQARIDTEAREYMDKYQKIGPDANRYAQVEEKVKARKQKLKILQDITGRKLERFKPVLILDILQVIKPAGVWFQTLSITNRSEDVQIDGGAFDNIILAEFLTNIKVTASQKISATDIRTQIFFSDMGFKHSRQAGADEFFRDIQSHYKFSVSFKIKNFSQKAPGKAEGDNKKVTLNLLDEFGEVSL